MGHRPGRRGYNGRRRSISSPPVTSCRASQPAVRELFSERRRHFTVIKTNDDIVMQAAETALFCRLSPSIQLICILLAVICNQYRLPFSTLTAITIFYINKYDVVYNDAQSSDLAACKRNKFMISKQKILHNFWIWIMVRIAINM